MVDRSHAFAVLKRGYFCSQEPGRPSPARLLPDMGLDTKAAPRCFSRLFQAKNARQSSIMALKIRLTKVGATHKPYYRVVVAEARSRRDGAATEVLGTYQPTNKVRAEQCKLDLARVDYWLSKGAKPTDTVHALIKRARKSPAAEAAAPVETAAAPATA